MGFFDFFKNKNHPKLEGFDEPNMINNLGSSWYVMERMTDEETDKWIDEKSKNSNLTLQQFFKNLNISIQDVLNRSPVNLDLLDRLTEEQQQLFHMKHKINTNLTVEKFIKNENIRI